MIKYLPILFLMACNSEIDRKETAVNVNTDIRDSLSSAIDSLKTDLASIKEVSDYAKDAQAKINQLEKENEALELERSKEISYTVSQDYTQYKSDDRDKRIYELTKELNEKKIEIARLKKTLADNSVKKNIDIVPEVTYEPEKPNNHSLVITLDRRMKNADDLPFERISVYILPYEKRKVKGLMKYEVNCGIDKFEAKQAGFFEGQYFFNDIPPGKYLIKICTLYGGYKVIERNDNYQMVAMKVAPPIQ